MPIFQDHFLDNRNQWETRDDKDILLRIGLGDYAYVFEHDDPSSSYTTWQPLFLDEPLDYKIHAVLERVAGGNNGFGLIWRCADELNCYSFEISRGAYYRVRKRTAGKWADLIPWTKSDAIRAGHESLNELLIQQLEDKANFLINGRFLTTLPLPEPPAGHGFGFVVNGVLSIRIHSTIVLRHVELKSADAALEQPQTDEAALQEVLAKLNRLIGMQNIKQEVSTLINLLRVQRLRQQRGFVTLPLSYHMVLTGPPGTGKTTVARLIGEIYRALGILSKGHLVETDRAGLVAPYVGQTAQRVADMVEKAMGGVLFVDEAYALMPKGDGQRNDFGQEAIEALLKRMEDQRGNFAVIIAGYADEMHRFLEANSGVKSRFNRYFYFEHYKPRELLQIFELFCREMSLILSPDAKAHLLRRFEEAYLARDRAFGNGRFARNLLEKTIERQANRIVNLQPLSDETLNTLTLPDVFT